MLYLRMVLEPHTAYPIPDGARYIWLPGTSPIPRDGSDPEVICITVNHAGLTSKLKDFRSNCKENARLRFVHHSLPKSVSVEYLPFD
ncbi:hypothetical protein TNCV_1306791 [Trichonephila clavipes]|nr:hypothetical protein TNCV_1306791 [Trichonephila clavipes]